MHTKHTHIYIDIYIYIKISTHIVYRISFEGDFTDHIHSLFLFFFVSFVLSRDQLGEEFTFEDFRKQSMTFRLKETEAVAHSAPAAVRNPERFTGRDIYRILAPDFRGKNSKKMELNPKKVVSHENRSNCLGCSTFARYFITAMYIRLANFNERLPGWWKNASSQKKCCWIPAVVGYLSSNIQVCLIMGDNASYGHQIMIISIQLSPFVAAG